MTNQIEYAIYNENKTQLNLSYCKDVQITVSYNIQKDSNLNKTKILYYSELGIDIFNNKDSFFNDLCYPFSISNFDIILKDRVLDIYQNYSLCDNGCEYVDLLIENMTAICSCQVKTEINCEVSSPVFSEIVQDTFKDSNIGVIRCYKLIFSFNNKLQNAGFLLFSFFVIINIICFIFYIFFGIKPIITFVFKEMERNNYITRIQNPKKKTKRKNNDIDQGYNSSIIDVFNKEIKDNDNIITKDVKMSDMKSKNQNTQPILILNYKCNNHYFKDNKNSHNSSKKRLFNTSKIKFSNTIMRKKIPKLNKEKNCPGYYNLIHINAKNTLTKMKPPESKYILNNYYYELAIKYETRQFWRIVYICLLSKENILNTFFFKSPLESQPLRLSLFIFTYSSDSL